MPALEISNLNVFYGPIQALWDVSLDVESGSISSIIGSNGAGKSTILRSIMGIVPSKSGKILFDGDQIDGLSPDRVVDRGIVYVPEGRHIFSDLSVRENLKMGAYPRRARSSFKAEIENVFEIFPLLRERSRQKAGTLSGGEAQMLAIGRALMSKPRFLLLDEPSAGLSPIMVQRIFEAIARIKALGITALLVEQDVIRALSNSSKSFILENGHVTRSAKGEELLKDEQVRKSYLGI
ncbi:MAG TPA: ABC transporter ATP-binding protein [Nitrososphaerales archaeon]|nr:ABC transporter ATP-binding protein [Nitrososphaerales archaeon]